MSTRRLRDSQEGNLAGGGSPNYEQAAIGELAGGLAAGLLANAVGGRKMRRFAGAAEKLGGAAAIGGLAWNAYGRFRVAALRSQSDDEPALPVSWQNLEETHFVPSEESSIDSRELLILRAIIAAANADGLIDRRERLLILSRIEAMDVSARDKAFLADEIEAPMSYEELAGFARSPELAAEIYAASLIAIDTESLESRAYLGALAQKLGIPRALARELHRDAALLGSESNDMFGSVGPVTTPDP